MLIDRREVPDELARRLIWRLKARLCAEPCPVPSLEKPCQLYIGPTFADGYGSIEVQKDKVRYGFYAHRVIYFLEFGPIPDGLTLDHLCRVRMCCEPTHLEPVTRGENVRRGTSHTPAVRARAGKAISDVQRGRLVTEATRERLRKVWTPEKRAALGEKQRSRMAK